MLVSLYAPNCVHRPSAPNCVAVLIHPDNPEIYFKTYVKKYPIVGIMDNPTAAAAGA
jgi:hypothetical protein